MLAFKRLFLLFGWLSLFTSSLLCAKTTDQRYFRSYWNPLYHGERLAYCSSNLRQCGLPIANRYCRIMGYEKAEQQIIDYNVGMTHFLDTRLQCKGWTCNGFMLIRCVSHMRHQPPESYYFRERTFMLPRYNRFRVDWCYKAGKQCGHRAAFSFCRRKGYMKDASFVMEDHVLATKTLGDQHLCFGKHCHGFERITCYR